MWSKKGDWLECIIPSFWKGRTIESLLKEVWCASKKLAHQLRMEKGVKLNGKEVSCQIPLQENDRLQLYLYKPEASSLLPEYRELSVLWEDEHLLIINKDAGMDIHPSEPSQTGTLANAVAFYFKTPGIF